MKRFRSILFVVEKNSDLYESAAEKVRELARLNDARVKVVGALEDGLLDLLGHKLFGADTELNSLAVENFHNEIEAALKTPEWDGIPQEVEILHGKTFISVIQQVLSYGFDLVVKQNNEPKGVDNLAMRLLRKCPCPIWLVKRRDTTKFRRILAAVDVSANDDETFLLNRKIFELAHSLAQREGGEAHYLYAWYLHSESMLRGSRFKVSENEILKYKEEKARLGRERMTDLFETIHINPEINQIHIIEGRTKAVIEQMIEEKSMDVLVMGTVGRTGIPGFLIGNTAESIVKDMKCSLMAVKPDGFVTPVS